MATIFLPLGFFTGLMGINVGGMHFDRGKQEMLPSVYVDRDDLVVFRTLLRRGLRVVRRVEPLQPPVLGRLVAGQGVVGRVLGHGDRVADVDVCDGLDAGEHVAHLAGPKLRGSGGGAMADHRLARARSRGAEVAFMFSGGNAGVASDCSGVIGFDVTQAFFATHGLTAGTAVYMQFLVRDPGFAPPDAVGLSDALTYVLQP